MDTKIIVVLDRMTEAALMVTRMASENPNESSALTTSGFWADSPTKLVLAVNLDNMKTCCVPEQWNDRTFSTAHQYIMSHFDELVAGSSIDVEFILGEVQRPRTIE